MKRKLDDTITGSVDESKTSRKRRPTVREAHTRKVVDCDVIVSWPLSGGIPEQPLTLVDDSEAGSKLVVSETSV